MDTTLVPANPPKVADVRFEGAHALSAAALRDAVARLVVGNRYSEREFRQVLDLNVRPLYEDRGYLKVEFPGPPSHAGRRRPRGRRASGPKARRGRWA